MSLFPFVMIIIVGALILVYFLRSRLNRERSGPDIKSRNDKLVLVKGMGYDELKKEMAGFCRMYNKRNYDAVPRLIPLSENEFVCTFPFDIEFETFCYFINYLHNPAGHNPMAKVVGWTTTRAGDPWITAMSENKNVMLFISPDDTEHDNVFLTTSDNIGYKLRFALGEDELLLEKPAKEYMPPPIGIDILTGQRHEDFG